MKNLPSFLLLVTLSSCGMYNSDFQCPAGKGIGCAPAGDVLDRIIEEEEGEDQFIRNRGEALLVRQEQNSDTKSDKKRSQKKKLHLVKTETGDLILVPSSQGKTHDPT